ncbi:MAG: preprotein translocase subunit SecA [Herpetosiphonaceae bacterium]|nr:preprotein translocase subunit SecA [Herpetosiphonaceae bacterium]
MFKWLGKLAGDPNAKVVKKMQPQVDAINALETQIKALSDDQLRAKTAELRASFIEMTADERAALDQRFASRSRHDSTVEKDYQKELREIEDGALDELLPEAFALVRESARRTIGQRHYDVQMIGGIVLHEGRIAEMKTGEGKTLVASLPLYLNALAGRGAHLITVNDYLAKVGGGWMAPIYYNLGMAVGYIGHEYSALYDPAYTDPDAKQDDSRLVHWRQCERREAYAADMVYGTNNEFGFDYLRDNMVQQREQRVQRELHYAIVDEVDNILIDEARTPLIISGPAQESSSEYARFSRLVRGLKPSTVSPEELKKTGEEADGDYWIDEKSRSITLSEDGLETMERRLTLPDGESLYDAKNYELTHYLENALKAEYVFHRDHDYVVQSGEVIIVDEFTGRTMPGRRWSDGLHQAVEAKEGVEVRRENVTLATITFQNYFRMYNKLAGMTGTALTEAEEFSKIYTLEVVVIPTNKSVVREDLRDQIYANQQAKYNALVSEIKEKHAEGRPILVGTTSIESSEVISRLLENEGLQHNLLNAKQHEREAYIVAQAGRKGAITIATNMAGRGTDILLGGNPDGLIEEKLRALGTTLTEATPEQLAQAQVEAQADVEAQRKEIIALGGLHIVGTERHEARRIDNQLRGRAGRQGDPGSSRFFLSLEDELLQRFGRMDMVKKWMTRLSGDEEDLPIEAGLLDKAIESAQTRVEGYNFDIRKHVVEYDDVVNKQREVIYADRQAILNGEDMGDRIFDMIADEIEAQAEDYLDSPELDQPDLDGFMRQLHAIAPRLKKDVPDLVSQLRGKQPEQAVEIALEKVQSAYDQLTEELMLQYSDLLSRDVRVPGISDPAGIFPHFERQEMLQAIDKEWIDYLTAVDEMRQGIGNVALAQQDPLVAFKREAFKMFDELKDNIQHSIVYNFFNDAANWQLRLRQVQAEAEARLAAAQTAGGSANATEDEDAPRSRGRVTTQRRDTTKIGRNEQCPCGSGKKFKQCHGMPGKEAELKLILAANGGAATPSVAMSAATPDKKGKGRGVSSR